MNELVQRLTTDQPVVASLRPEPTVEGFKAAIDRGYVHVLFTETRGGTELGVRIDPKYLDLSAADFEHKTGSAKLAGELILDYTRVRCHATIDLATLRGTGRLEPLGDVEPGSTAAAGGEAQ
ncbi:MAG TPA: MbtH domain protein [Thermoanaerobaculia bacterium]|nr:MbtH domain protein [Thermoanaerobaculia bacterium]